MTTHYANANALIDRQRKAIEEAKEILKSQGFTYPVLSSITNEVEVYDKLRDYAQREAALIVEILRRPIGGERPLEVDNTNQRRENWYDK